MECLSTLPKYFKLTTSMIFIFLVIKFYSMYHKICLLVYILNNSGHSFFANLQIAGPYTIKIACKYEAYCSILDFNLFNRILIYSTGFKVFMKIWTGQNGLSLYVIMNKS